MTNVGGKDQILRRQDCWEKFSVWRKPRLVGLWNKDGCYSIVNHFLCGSLLWNSPQRSFFKGRQNNLSQTGWLKQQNFLTMLEAKSLRSKCRQGWILLRTLSLAGRWSSSPCVFMWSSLLYVPESNLLFFFFNSNLILFLNLIFSSYKDISHVELGPTPFHFI